MGKAKFTAHDISRIHEMRERGTQINDICTELGISRATVQRALRQPPPSEPVGKTFTYKGYSVVLTVDGRVWSKNSRRYIGHQRDDGYWVVTLADKTFYVHLLIIEAFKGQPKPGQECRHLDGDPSNSAASNLGWGSSQRNKADMKFHKTAPILVDRHNRAKLVLAEVFRIRRWYAQTKLSHAAFCKQAGRKFNVTPISIHNVVVRRTWVDVEDALSA